VNISVDDLILLSNNSFAPSIKDFVSLPCYFRGLSDYGSETDEFLISASLEADLNGVLLCSDSNLVISS
jgi:hypothetical protein